MPSDPHEELRELCALSTTGELTEAEWSRLEDHLAHCTACRELHSQYQRVVATALPPLAPASWSIDEAEARLMEALRNEQAPSSLANSVAPPHSSRRHYLRRYAIAALILGGCTVAYQIGVVRGRRSEAAIAPTAGTVANLVSHQNPSRTSAPAPAQIKTAPQHDESSRLESQLRSTQVEVASLKDELQRTEEESTKQSAELDRNLQDRSELERELAETQARLSALGSQTSQETVELLGLKTRVSDLNADLAEKDKEIARVQELLQRDRDIRNLVGARNLYIAEIYDIAKSGDTQKPFGRVFYTKDKSLIFYGYDLDQQKGLKKETSFQAWGRRGTDRHQDVSLGLLYQDDANQKRWVLKFNDPKTIAQIDAVFITAEPEGGSSKPSGKPLLFTYLRLDPNHP